MYLGLDNVHRWIRRYRKRGRKGLLQKRRSPNRMKAFIVDLRRQRGCEESEAAFRRHLESEHDIVVSESWLAKVLAEAKLTSRLRLGQKAWREKVVEIYRLHAPVANFSRFWRDVLQEGHDYPYTIFCARNSVEAAGFALIVPGRDPSSIEERRRLVIRLYKLHSPVPRIDVFLEMLRRKHGVAMTLKALRDVLDEAGLRPKQIHKSR
jgi:transposase